MDGGTARVVALTGPLELVSSDGARLASLRRADAAALLSVIAGAREDFDPWLRWSATIDGEVAAGRFIADFTDREAEGRGFHLGIWVGGALVGGVACWTIDPVHRVAEVGYWLAPGERGRRRVGRATAAVVDHLFGERGVNRVEFQCRVENAPSRRVAERLGGRLEGVRRQSHLIGGAFRDHAVYSILAEEWRGEEGGGTGAVVAEGSPRA